VTTTLIKEYVTIPGDALTKREWKQLFKRLTFIDGEGRVLECWRPKAKTGAVQIPRGAWSLLPDRIEYRDKRSLPLGNVMDFELELEPEGQPQFEGQKAAVKSMFKQEQGMIIRPPGSGKTQVALAFIAQAGTPTLVLVHTEDILNQWIEYTKRSIPEAEIGMIRGSTVTVGDITFATVQTFYQMMLEEPEKWRDVFGCVIVDEAHHAPANTWEVILNNLSAYYRFGFTASPTRADGMHPYINILIGPVIHRKKFKSQVPLTVQVVKTDFRYRYRGAWDWGNLVRELITSTKRNRQIAEVVDGESRAGNSILVLSRRVDHLERIAGLMHEPCEILAAKTTNKSERKRILSEFRDGRTRVVLATQLADEALDIPRLSRIALVHPGKHEGRIIQQVGRTIRKHPDKVDAVIYDFADMKVGILRRQFLNRKRSYKKMGAKLKGVLL